MNQEMLPEKVLQVRNIIYTTKYLFLYGWIFNFNWAKIYFQSVNMDAKNMKVLNPEELIEVW